jgi:hypothetical protein
MNITIRIKLDDDEILTYDLLNLDNNLTASEDLGLNPIHLPLVTKAINLMQFAIIKVIEIHSNESSNIKKEDEVTEAYKKSLN